LSLSCLLLYLLVRRLVGPKRLPLPPGPKGLPLIGNLLDIPSTRACVVYREWGLKYGDVVHAAAMGKHFIILNSLKASLDLLDYRSINYSDRPPMPMLHDEDLMNAGWAFPLMRYNYRWKKYRRLFMQYLGPSGARAFHGRQAKSVHILLRTLLDDQRRYGDHLKYAAASIVLGIAYGFDVRPDGDPHLDLGIRMSQYTAEGLGTSFLVNVFPCAKRIPAWCPGGGFHAFAAKARELNKELLNVPYEASKKKIIEGTATPCFVGNVMPELQETSDPELVDDVKAVAAAIYAAGSDSTVAALHNFILAMLIHPHVQQRIQEELDQVCESPNSPSFRLPTHNDRSSLPYLEAALKESLRWIPPLGTGVPHACSEEDVYRGWRIPEGSIVVANAWGILHDEKLYPEPFVFRPERFLSEKYGGSNKLQPDPGASGVFGFGRRLCAGRHLAESALWIEAAGLLAAFTIEHAQDENGNEI
ncbi:hypothetical protein M422DRAFT_88287, partial [Sphaerobolus stellatus SS14]